MKKSLKKVLKSYVRLGYRPIVKPAPEGAVSWDRMILIPYNDTLQTVIIYNTKTESVVGRY
jgi:hypothetical protein